MSVLRAVAARAAHVSLHDSLARPLPSPSIGESKGCEAEAPPSEKSALEQEAARFQGIAMERVMGLEPTTSSLGTPADKSLHLSPTAPNSSINLSNGEMPPAEAVGPKPSGDLRNKPEASLAGENCREDCRGAPDALDTEAKPE
jgi:hypothetical protein